MLLLPCVGRPEAFGRSIEAKLKRHGSLLRAPTLD
jgi:hypothetical protein